MTARAPARRRWRLGERALPLCLVPFQVPDGAGTRGGPDKASAARAILASGHLTWTVCEAAGTTLGKPGFWLKMDTGDWISSPLTTKTDPYTRHPAVPLCS